MFQAAAAAAPPAEGRNTRQKTDTKKGPGEAQVEKTVHKMLWSVDNRLRHIEGRTTSFFLVEGETFLIPALEQANKGYDSKMQKGQAHPDGPRRTTLAAGALNAIAAALRCLGIDANDPVI